jgi:hypothetical protein
MTDLPFSRYERDHARRLREMQTLQRAVSPRRPIAGTKRVTTRRHDRTTGVGMRHDRAPQVWGRLADRFAGTKRVTTRRHDRTPHVWERVTTRRHDRTPQVWERVTTARHRGRGVP